jgi:hypothetical protein
MEVYLCRVRIRGANKPKRYTGCREWLQREALFENLRISSWSSREQKGNSPLFVMIVITIFKREIWNWRNCVPSYRVFGRSTKQQRTALSARTTRQV